jgi:asparagine synthase (glutamine-hydrolysing)
VSGLCGICEPGTEIPLAALSSMRAALAKFGDDGESFVGRSIALGVAQRWESQEIATIQGVRIAADTDLTNWHDAQTCLDQAGISTAQMSRAEMLAWLYKVEGANFLSHLEGAFAIALWDEGANRLLLAVDPLGIKSLYFAQDDNRLLFASRATAVRSAQRRAAEIDPSAVTQFLIFSVVPAPLSIFRGIERLQPGFVLAFENGRVQQTQYWDLRYVESDNNDEKYWTKELREQMRAAVYRHLAGCNTDDTGAYLSGGTDSSSVVAFMSDRLSQVQSFSISFPITGFNEIEYARTTAKHFESRHHELCLSPQDAIDAIPKVIEYYDEPFANSSALASYHCALLAKRSGVDTLLAGDGGDELFAGNERYATDQRFSRYQSVPRWLRRSVLEPVARLLPADGGLLSLPRRYIRRANIPNPRRLFSYSVFLSTDPREIFELGFLEQAPPAQWMNIAERHFNGAEAHSDLNRMMHLDVKIILADNDLKKVSGTAEIAGVRVRYPLLDRRLAEFSGTIPTRLKMKGSAKRYIFKEAMRGILPDAVLFKKKHGFGVPIGDWLLHNPGLKSLAQDVLNDPRTRQRGYFRTDFYDRVASLHRSDHAGFYGEVIWYLVALELWHREHMEGATKRNAVAD